MEMGFLRGSRVMSTEVHIRMTKGMGMGRCIGMMVLCIRVAGQMVNRRVREYYTLQMDE